MDFKTFAINLAEQAGTIINTNFTLGMKKEWKADVSPVTETDLAINTLVIESVHKHFPDHDILAEEESSMTNQSDYIWVCDPVDGTIAFSHGVPTCVFSLALVHKGESILGVVYDPFMKRLFHAEKGKGAHLNDTKIRVSQITKLKGAIIGVGAWRNAPYNTFDAFEKIENQYGITMTVGSTTYMGALVAVGEFAGNIFPSNKPHDTAALKVIVEEAGGKVTDLYGNDQRYDRPIKGHIISNGYLHQELLQIVQSSLR